MKCSRKQPLAIATSFALVAGFFCSSALADDLAPPPWRGAGPYWTYSEWLFPDPNSMPPADFTLNVGDGVPPSGVSQPTATILGMRWDPGTPDTGGGWMTIDPGIPGLIQLEIPNWIDTEPIKHIRVQLTYINDGNNDPFIDSISGQDGIDPVLGVPEGPPVFTELEPFIHWHWYQDWTMRPNPDWEIIQIVVPGDIFLHQIVVDTLSIPEPASFVLLAIGMAALSFRRGVSVVARPRTH